MNTKLLVTGAVVGVFAATTASAGVRGSKHDLSAVTNSPTTEVCVFCHTPHGANTAAAAPLWNRVLGDPAQYTRYSSLGTATLDGEEVDVGSVSLACLSCHDGTQARDVVINVPGSGGHNLAGAPINGTGSVIPALSGTPVPALGTDLTDDHPISIAYAGGACIEDRTATGCDPATKTLGDPDFNRASYALINTRDNWWVDTPAEGGVGGNADVRDKTDMILYTRAFAGRPDGAGGTILNGSGPSVECGSCHDPHEDAARPVSFLRISNNNSNVCLACHTK